jgi:D-sedoheptulose 7-phosphate isomerase
MSPNFPVVYKAEFLKAIETVDLEKVAEAIRIFSEARAEGRQIFVCGNGGSAATASHFAMEMVKAIPGPPSWRIPTTSAMNASSSNS